jgi:hypothetical protein
VLKLVAAARQGPRKSKSFEWSAEMIAWRDNGTRCGRFIFMVSAGTVQTAFSKSISFHRASRNSPGRANRSAES